MFVYNPYVYIKSFTWEVDKIKGREISHDEIGNENDYTQRNTPNFDGFSMCVRCKALNDEDDEYCGNAQSEESIVLHRGFEVPVQELVKSPLGATTWAVYMEKSIGGAGGERRARY